MTGTPAEPVQPRDVARVLAEIAMLMELNGRDTFRARAFRNAARALEGTDADLPALARAGKLSTLRGIGPGIAAVIGELVLTGRSTVHEQLDAATPVGLFDLIRIPGLGNKRIHSLHAALGIDSLDALEGAARAGKLAALPGFGARTEKKILEGIAFARASAGVRRYPEAVDSALDLVEWLRARPEVAMAEVVGAVRRRAEVVDRIDLVTASIEPDTTIAEFSALNGASEVHLDRPGRASLTLSDGLVAALLCVSPEAFVAAVVWETGSDAHRDALAARAAAQGLTFDERGLWRGDERLELLDEEALYAALDLAYVPPELREGLDEIERAADHRIPRLVGLGDLCGTFHCHTTYSDGKSTVAEMAEAARSLEWRYLGLADHSPAAAYANGLSAERVAAQQNEIDAWNAAAEHAGGPPFRLFKGTESDILADGSLDYPDDVLATFDYVVASVHSSFGMPEARMTERVIRAVRHPSVTILGHPTGRLLLRREGYAIDLTAVIDAAAEAGVVIEINANPHRLDLDWRDVRYAVERGVLIAINPDAHSAAALEQVVYGINMARKAGLEASQILNCWTLDDVTEYLAARKHRQ